MWVIAVDVVVVILGVALLGLLAWRVVIRPGLALSRAVSSVATQAGEALDLLSQSQTASRDFHPYDTNSTSGPRLPNEGIDVPLEMTPGDAAGKLRGKV